MDITALSVAFGGGLLPALLWLFFWLRQDKLNPEPKFRIMFTFVAGMAAVAVVIPVQHFVFGYLAGVALLIVWAGAEEIVKYLGARVSALRSTDMDEPIDGIIYMITAALGFSAAENTLFLINPLLDGNITQTILTGNFRFIGATLLHVLASSIVGIAIATTFYKRPHIKRAALGFGLILAVALHTLFNAFIMSNEGERVLLAFAGVWLGVIVLILLFEKIKRIRKPLSRRS